MVVDSSNEEKLFDAWLKDVKVRHNQQCNHIKFLKESKRLDETGFRALDSTFKKITSFTKKLKNIGTTVLSTSIIAELEKLNVSKYLDEIAANICQAKIKISDISSLIDFCVRVASLYSDFPDILTAELRKNLPYKKTSVISNPSKLRVDLRFLSELILHGVLMKEGVQLLGAVLSCIINMDKVDHINASILMPFCRTSFFDISGVVPLSQKSLAEQRKNDIPVSSTVFTDDQKTALVVLFKSYVDSLIEHVNATCLEMNCLHKSIKRQERTRGDALVEDRQKFEQIKSVFDRLLQHAKDLSECLSQKMPDMPEELSDDEPEDIAAKKLDTAFANGKMTLWSDLDTQLFYEKLIDLNQLCRKVSTDHCKDDADDIGVEEDFTFHKQEINESVNNVDLTNLEEIRSIAEQSQINDDEEEAVDEEDDEQMANVSEEFGKMSETDLLNRGTSANIKEFFLMLTHCINRNLIDNAAIEFVTHFNKKAHRKRLTQHLLNPPLDRFDLLPFYACFIATIKPVLPNVCMQVSHELLRRFRDYSKRTVDLNKKGFGKIDRQLHVSNYISELVKFSVLPKAEALACFRTLLVDFRHYKIDMLCAMIESMGLFLYFSPESHAKMSVIMQVLRNKTLKIKDPRQQILADNAYFSVIPPEDQIDPVNRLPPIQEFLQQKIISTENRLLFFRKINWDDEELTEFVLRMFSDSCRVRFDDLDRMASLVSGLCDYQEWIGVRVVDEVLEFIRLYLEVNHPSLQQRGFSSIIYIGQLFNYNVCGTTLIVKVLYQLITLGIHKGELSDDLIICTQRIRLVCELVNIVCEFFCKGSSKIKMDCFLTFFYCFYYEVVEKWSELLDELGDFPQEINYSVKELVKTWRNKEKFPNDLESARKAVIKLEEQYKTKVEEIIQNLREFHDDEDRDEKRLDCIAEEEESEEEEAEDVVDEEFVPNGLKEECCLRDDNLDEEQICVRTERVLLPEDEDFMRDLDRIVSEAMQSSSASLKVPLTDLEIPPVARQKFERRITFASDVETKSNFTKENVNSIVIDSLEKIKPTNDLQMALMTRGKGNRTILKAVKIQSSETMHASWRQHQEAREKERRELKQLTLAMNDRMQNQSQDETIQEEHNLSINNENNI